MNKYRIGSIRLQKWDYGWRGKYFITICTRDRKHFFGEICKNRIYLSKIGSIAQQFILSIHDHFPFAYIDTYVIMPNHIHVILILDKPYMYDDNDIDNDNNDNNNNVESRQCLYSTTSTEKTTSFKNPIIPLKSICNDHKKQKLTPGQKRFQNQGKNTVSSIIGSYKSIVTKNARKIDPTFEWQSGFYDRILFANKQLLKVRKYINENPIIWARDRNS